MTAAADPALPVLDPSLEIVDAHHHLGDKYDPPYFLDELLADVGAGHRVTQTIFVECGGGWPKGPNQELVSIPEIEAVAAMAMESRARGGAQISGIVGHIDLRLGVPATNRALDAASAAAQGLLVGIRHATAWDESPQLPTHRTNPGPALLGSETFRLGLAELARRNLAYDAWLFHPQLPELEAVAGRIPDLKIVVDHLGGPLGIGPYSPHDVDADWRSSMSALARHENVFVKLGGIGMPLMVMSEHRGATATAELLAKLWGDRISWCIDTFGPTRCMFESDFPVDRATCSYSTIWTTFKMISHDFSDSEKAALFHQTARDVYGLQPIAPAGES